MVWVGPCWHQSSISTCSGPTAWSPSAVKRDSLALATHPLVVGPGGVGHWSFQVGAVPPIGAS